MSRLVSMPARAIKRRNTRVPAMAETFAPEEIAILDPYVTNVDRPIFALRNLPEEVVAVLFAYYSRSRETLRRNLLRLIQERDVDLEGRLRWSRAEEAELALAREKARQFHEKWVVGYGHASVAEHAVAHLAVEDVSIVASKVIEDMRLASYTEKSTRYVLFDPERFHRPPRLMASRHADRYLETIGLLMKAYTTLTGPVTDGIKARNPRDPSQGERAYDAACRAKACDILRYILPAATFTNIGLTINGRALEHLVTKLLSDPLEEVRAVGAMMKEEALKVIPTLIKYAAYNPYLAETRAALESLALEILGVPRPDDGRSVILVRYEADADNQLAAAILYAHGRSPFSQILDRVKHLAREEKERIIDEYLRRRGPHDQPLRALEHLSYTLDILVDYGAFRDIQRHRMATQIRQPFTPDHGYSTPPELIEYGHRQLFEECMGRAAEAYSAIARDLREEAPYVLPLAFRQRVLFTWNLRELFHFIQLRSARQGHVSYRRIAQEAYREVERVHPLFARYIRVDLSDYPFARL